MKDRSAGEDVLLLPGQAPCNEYVPDVQGSILVGLRQYAARNYMNKKNKMT